MHDKHIDEEMNEAEEVKELDEDEKFLEETMIKSINIMFNKMTKKDREKIFLACLKIHNRPDKKSASRW